MALSWARNHKITNKLILQMALCNDIMWMVGQYVNTFRNNKKIETLFNIVPTETEIQNITHKYNNMTYKNILINYKVDKRDYNDINVHYKSGKNGTRTKSDKQKELVVYELRSIINKKFIRLQKELKYNNPNYPNIKNILTNDKLHINNSNFIAIYNLEKYNNKFKKLQKEYLMTILNENDKNTLETYSNLVNNHLEDDNDLIKDRVTYNYLEFIQLLKTKYDMRSWNNSWVKIKNPKSLKISNLYDTFIPKEFLINNSKHYVLWKR